MMNAMISSITAQGKLFPMRTQNVPPSPPSKTRDSGEDDNRRLNAILNWNDKKYIVECRSRKLTTNYAFHNEELGEVVFDEDGFTQLYSPKQLDPAIYSWMRRIIKAWKMHYPNF